MENNEQVAKLLEQFPASDIEFLSKGGRKFAYVSHAACTRRLIDVFGLGWSFEVVDTRIEPEAVAVLGRLTCAGATRMQWGGKDRKGMDLDDALKSAGSYALKKCASLFGVGLYLWDDAPTEQDNSRALRQEQAHAQRSAPPTTTATTATPTATATPKAAEATQAHTAERVRSDRQPAPAEGGQRQSPGVGASERQLNAIMAIGRSMGWSSETVRQHAIDNFSAPTNQLTSKQASSMITQLQELAKKAAA